MLNDVTGKKNAILENSKVLKAIQKKYPGIDFLEHFYNGRTSDYHILEYLQSSLQDVSDDITLMVMSPEDINFLRNVATTALIQNNFSEKSFYIKLIEDVVKNKLAEGGVDLKDVHMIQNPEYMLAMFADPLTMDDNAYSCSMPYETEITKDGIVHKKAINFIVMPHYSKMFPSILGWDHHEFAMLKKKGVSLLECYMATAYHEAGHSMDPKNALKGTTGYYYPNNVLANYERYRTECVADVFSALMMAKTTKSTAMAEIDMMSRGKHLYQQYQYYNDIANSEITFLIEKTALANFKQMGYSEEHIKNVIKTNDDIKMKSLWSRTLYYTAPSIDYAIKVADHLIKSGEIDKLSAKEIMTLSVDIAENTMFDRNHILDMFKSIIKGDTNNELFTVMKKYTDNAYKYFNKSQERSKKYQKEMKRTLNAWAHEIGLPVEETEWEKLKKDIKDYEKFDFSKTNRKLLVRIQDYEARLESHLESVLRVEPSKKLIDLENELNNLMYPEQIPVPDELADILNEIGSNPNMTEELADAMMKDAEKQFPKEVAALDEMRNNPSKLDDEDLLKISKLEEKLQEEENRYNAESRMLYMLETLKFANNEIDSLNSHGYNNPTTTLTEFNFDKEYRQYIKDTSIDFPYWISTQKLREIDFKDMVFKNIDVQLQDDYNPNLKNNIINYFYYKGMLIGNIVDFLEDGYVEPKSYFDLQEATDKKQKMLSEVTELAAFEKCAAEFAVDIFADPKFEDYKEKHSQFYNHIKNTANGKLSVLSAELYTDIAFDQMPHEYIYLAERKMLRDMLRQGGLGEKILGGIENESAKDIFVNTLLSLNGHNLLKKIIRANMKIPKYSEVKKFDIPLYSDVKKALIAIQLGDRIRD